jgi:large subunit ribosomal protein L25
MEEKKILNAKKRGGEKKANTLRLEGFLPAILYGHSEKNINLTLDYSQFLKVFKLTGSSGMISLRVDEGKPINVIVQEVQRDPVSDKFIHIDFYKVKMDEKITAEIRLVFEGESPAVKGFSGTLIRNHDILVAECLPGDLISEIKVDIASLKELHDSITVRDLHLPENLKPQLEDDEVIATVIPPRVEKQVVETTETVEGEETLEGEQKEEVEGEEKKEAEASEKK